MSLEVIHFLVLEYVSVDRFPVYADCREQLGHLGKKSEALLSKYQNSCFSADINVFDTIQIKNISFSDDSSSPVDFVYASTSENKNAACVTHDVEVYVAKYEERTQAKQYLNAKLKENKVFLFLMADSENEKTIDDDTFICRTTKTKLFSDIDNMLERYAFKPLAEDLWGSEQKYLTGHSYCLRKRLTGDSISFLKRYFSNLSYFVLLCVEMCSTL